MWFYFNVFCFTCVFYLSCCITVYLNLHLPINMFTLSQEWNWLDNRAQDGRSQSISQMTLKYCVFAECHHFIFMMPDSSRWYRVGLLQLKWSAVEKHLAIWETHALKTKLPAECDIICYCNAGGTVFRCLQYLHIQLYWFLLLFLCICLQIWTE